MAFYHVANFGNASKLFVWFCLVGTRSSSLLKKHIFFPVFQSFRVYLQFVWKVRSKTHPIPEKQVPCFNTCQWCNSFGDLLFVKGSIYGIFPYIYVMLYGKMIGKSTIP